ncbi:hypothetical protein HDV00_002210 [Rhizophlyctis rosea]|nr:hypothetical protein HDV00_002210 [Rhizophlyctis rosea]
MEQPQVTSTRGPLTRGAITAGHYVPTMEEKVVIQKANEKFRNLYMSGILAGVGVGFLVLRRRQASLASVPGASLMAACGLTGEVLGRTVGKNEAKRIMLAELPEGQLRNLMQNKEPLDLSTGDSQGSIPQTHNHGLEGTTLDPPQPQPQSPSFPFKSAPQPQPSPSEPYQPQQQQDPSTWDTIRSRNNPNPSIWDRLRTGRAPPPTTSPPPSSEEDSFLPPHDSVTTLPRTREETTRLLDSGALRPALEDISDRGGTWGRDGDAPVGTVSSVDGRNPSVGGWEGGVPRTREDLEESVRQGRVRRNRYGDLME